MWNWDEGSAATYSALQDSKCVLTGKKYYTLIRTLDIAKYRLRRLSF